MDNKVAEAVEFFKKQRGLHRLMRLAIEKYRTYGRLAGTLKLVELTPQEREALSELFRRDYTSQHSATISLAKLAEALEKTRFAGVALTDILEGYQGASLMSKAEERAEYEAGKERFFREFLDAHPGPRSWAWVENILAKGPGTRSVHQAYDRDREGLRRQLDLVLRALESLPMDPVGEVRVLVGEDSGCADDPWQSVEGGCPSGSGRAGRAAFGGRGRYERLPVFARRVAGDPHAFDVSTDQGRHLIAALGWIRHVAGGGDYEPQRFWNSEEVSELLADFGIIRDDLLNFATCVGILGFSAPELRLLDTWAAAAREGTVLNVPLREIVKASVCVPAAVGGEPCRRELHWHGDPSLEDGDELAVYVVENSGVFSAILDQLEIVPPMVCTHGQFRLACLMLLDRLVKGGAVIYYSGDFDPEGLQMAQKLIQRYPGRVRPWRYSLDDYQTCMPGTMLPESPVLPESRLAKLAGVTAPELAPVRDEMLARRRAGYQEGLIEQLAEDVRRAIRAKAH